MKRVQKYLLRSGVMMVPFRPRTVWSKAIQSAFQVGPRVHFFPSPNCFYQLIKWKKKKTNKKRDFVCIRGFSHIKCRLLISCSSISTRWAGKVTRVDQQAVWRGSSTRWYVLHWTQHLKFHACSFCLLAKTFPKPAVLLVSDNAWRSWYGK